jgi:molybdenum cofactor cytidylyltransferase
MSSSSVAVLILAAGSSSRLGSPKQLLKFEGKTLLQHAVDEAKQAGADPVVVVTGAVDLDMQAKVHAIKNKNWQEGMASSIRSGIAYLQQMAEVDAVIIMVCDQPYADSGLLKSLIHQQQKSGKPIVASEYAGRAGTPALFYRSFFNELMQLKGDVGARHLIAAHKELADFVGFPDGITDIDTLRDYEAITAEKKHHDQGRI